MIASNLYNDDEGEEQSSPLFARPFKPAPFDPSPARADDIAVCMAACANGRESITIAGARQWQQIEKDRITNADKRQRAKLRYAAMKASLKPASRKA